MKSRLELFIISVSIILIQSSCITHKKLTYLTYKEDTYESGTSEISGLIQITPATYKVMPFDNLFIRVLTPDPQWSALFNIMPVGAGGNVTEESAALFGYPVDLNGDIEIPFVGNVKVGGKTLSEIKIQLDSVFTNYVEDASITVRLVNNYLSVLGEVVRPGRYPLTKYRLNIFEAISMAGDLTVFSNRQKVQLIRPSPYGPLVKEFSLSDRSILTSEYYYVMPNDIIYVKPVSGRMFGFNTSIYSVFLSTITTALVIISYFRNLQ